MATRTDAASTAADLIQRLGLIDLIIPTIRARVQKIDADTIVDDAVEYLRRNPEILVVLFGSLTVTTGLIVYLVRRAEEEEREAERRREERSESRPSPKSRTPAKRRTVERKE
ncbi:MAG: hypothetical protein JWO56_1454 [Acidobacteria bacterium]|nr:hypothetical protein [Acidobacteriota bacterium]